MNPESGGPEFAASESTSVPAASQPVETPAFAPSAMRDLGSNLRLWLVAIVGLTADLWTKHWAFSSLQEPPVRGRAFQAVPHLVSFRRSLNTGALFGLGKGLTPVFIAASLLALGFVLFLFYHSDRKRWSLHIALGLVLAGALGNLFDRAFMKADVIKYTENGQRVAIIGKVTSPPGQMPIIIESWPSGGRPFRIPGDANPEVRQQGVVRDFVKIEPSFNIGGRRIDLWPWVFNVADALLVAGVGILMVNFWRERHDEKDAPLADSPASST